MGRQDKLKSPVEVQQKKTGKGVNKTGHYMDERAQGKRRNRVICLLSIPWPSIGRRYH
ncbi:hypothetical protein [Streptomyces sp. NPDC086787]|uniref:hypothetical protein n=1 Tax=Streptomyces sp. NPDC086787 TaxID=3365759 RepID=UPI00380B09B6